MCVQEEKTVFSSSGPIKFRLLWESGFSGGGFPHHGDNGLNPAPPSLVCLYPGTVYQPYQPILLQSLRNRWVTGFNGHLNNALMSELFLRPF